MLYIYLLGYLLMFILICDFQHSIDAVDASTDRSLFTSETAIGEVGKICVYQTKK